MQPLPTTIPTNPCKVEITFECFNLKSGLITQPNPYIELHFLIDQANSRFLGATERVAHRTDPKFKKIVVVDFEPAINQSMKVIVLDKGMTGTDVLGIGFFQLAECMCPDGKPISLNWNGEATGTVLAKGSILPDSPYSVRLLVAAKGLHKSLFQGQLNPFLRISRPTHDFEKVPDSSMIPPNQWVIVYETEKIHDSLEPTFKPFDVDLAILNRNNLETINRWEIAHHPDGGINTMLGEVFVSITGIVNNNLQSLQLLDAEKRPSGILLLDIKKNPNMITSGIAFAKLGLRVSISFGIDYSQSSASLHRLNGVQVRDVRQMNEYQIAIKVICDSLKSLGDEPIGVHGFGAQVPAPFNDHNQCFALNFDKQCPFVMTADQVLTCYENALMRAIPDQTTKMSLTIIEAYNRVNNDLMQGIKVYKVVVILTHGMIDDLEKCQTYIAKTADKPISIVIVGVGYEGELSRLKSLDNSQNVQIGASGAHPVRQNCKVYLLENFPTLEGMGASILADVTQQIHQYFAIHH